MPRYYFDIHNGFQTPDQEGTELLGVVHARMEAVKFAGVYLNQDPELVWDSHELRVLVFDEYRTLLTTVRISASDSQPMQKRIDDEESKQGSLPSDIDDVI